jgi:hypothetical protein
MDRKGPKKGYKGFVRYITVLSSADTYSQQFKFTDKCYASQLKPILTAMKCIGMLPINTSKSGELQIVVACSIFALQQT